MRPGAAWLSALLLVPSAAVAAGADNPAVSEQAVLAAVCYGCHRLNTETGPGQLPVLTGQSAAAIERALLEYRSDRRTGTLMNRIAKGYSEAQLKTLAQHLGAQPTD